MANDNKTYLYKQWLKVIPALAYLFLIFYAAANSIASGNVPWESLFILLVPVLFIGLVIWRTRSDIARLIRKETPDEWVAYIRENLQRMPDADAWIAHGTGIAYAYHGQFDKAYAQLSSVRWSDKVPLVSAAGLSLESILEHLKNGNYYRGSGLARQAYTMVADMPMNVPGVKKALMAYDTWAAAGEVLCGRAKPNMVLTLEKNLPRMELLMRPFVAWTLAIWYHRAGDRSTSERWLAFARSIVPYCKPLTQLPLTLDVK